MDRIETIKNFLKENPDDNFLQHALALEYVKSGNGNKARELFETILNRDEGYVGSYYHLASLLVRLGEREEAAKVYEKGMNAALHAGDNHAYNELRSAYENVE